MWIRHWARTQRLTCASLIRWRWLQSIHIRNSGGWLKWMMEDVDTCLQTMWWFVILCELLPTDVVQCGTVHREPIVCVDQLWQLSDPVIQTRPDGSSTARFNICAGLDNFLLLFCSAASDFGLSTNVRPCWGAIDMVWFHDPIAPGHAGTAPPTQLLWLAVWLARQSGIPCRAVCRIWLLAGTVSDNLWRCFCLQRTNAISTLEVSQRCAI